MTLEHVQFTTRRDPRARAVRHMTVRVTLGDVLKANTGERQLWRYGVERLPQLRAEPNAGATELPPRSVERTF